VHLVGFLLQRHFMIAKAIKKPKDGDKIHGKITPVIYHLAKLVHLVGFITKKSVTMHGHMNVKKCPNCIQKVKYKCRIILKI